MELYQINLDNNTSTLSESDCSGLCKIQLLNIKNKCIFSKIAKSFISQNGFNENNIHVVIAYNCRNSNMFHDKDFIDNKSNQLTYAMKNVIILNNEGIISLYSKTLKQCLFYYAKKGECIFVDNTFNAQFSFTNKVKTLTFYYFKKRPNLSLCYTSEETKERDVSLLFLKPTEFIKLLNPIKTINSHFSLKLVEEYIDKYQQDDENIKNNKDKKFFVSAVNSETDNTNMVNNSINKDEPLNELDLIDYHSIYENTIFDYYNLLIEYNSKEKEQCKNLLREFKDYSNNFFNTLNTANPKVLFINKVNKSVNEKLIANIANNVLEKCAGINYNSFYHDIVVNNDSTTLHGTNLICNFIITFENKFNKEEFIVLKDEHPRLQSNHIYNINPVEFNIICFRENHLTKNTINPSKYIQIQVYETIGSNYFQNTFNLKKTFYINDNKINNDSINNENICSEIKYTVNDCERITIFDKNIFNVENIQKLYKNSIEKNKVIHFFYNPGLTMLDRVDTENEELFKINSFVVNEFYNKRLLNIKENICNTSTTVINNQNYYFYEFIFLFQNLVSKAINELYGDHYSLNIVKCIVIGNKYDSNEENMALSYNDRYNYNKQELVIYADINIKDKDNIINLYTNYTQYNYDKKNTIRYIIVAVNNKNDIINVNEQKELIEFMNKEVTSTKNSTNKTFFHYEDLNRSYMGWNRHIPDTETHIKTLIEDIRQRIIEKENIVFTNEPSKLPSFIQVLEENAATHFHTDMSDTDNYHIRFNVIVQNAKKGGIPVYNGIVKPCQERNYILCRSGLDTHCSTVVKGDKPRIIISFGFNIPIKDAHKYPHIFPDSIQK